LGLKPYEQAYQVQCEHHQAVLESRDSDQPELGRLLMVEHPAVITVTRRPEAASHVIASESLLAQQGVELHQTDRGGDVTYHGPGQLVCYPIVDLNAVKIRIHEYIRLLESAVIETLANYDIVGSTDPEATGVWIDPKENPQHRFESDQPAKVCAIGVRVRKWITLHGLAINLSTNMDHYKLIVPCGLSGRPVISIEQILGERSPSMADLIDTLSSRLSGLLLEQFEAATSKPTH
jgi:lipoate-protein ligase B